MDCQALNSIGFNEVCSSLTEFLPFYIVIFGFLRIFKDLLLIGGHNSRLLFLRFFKYLLLLLVRLSSFEVNLMLSSLWFGKSVK